MLSIFWHPVRSTSCWHTGQLEREHVRPWLAGIVMTCTLSVGTLAQIVCASYLIIVTFSVPAGSAHVGMTWRDAKVGTGFSVWSAAHLIILSCGNENLLLISWEMKLLQRVLCLLQVQIKPNYKSEFSHFLYQYNIEICSFVTVCNVSFNISIFKVSNRTDTEIWSTIP